MNEILLKNKFLLIFSSLLFLVGFSATMKAQGTINFVSEDINYEEFNAETTCNASVTYDIGVLGIQVDPAVTITVDAIGGTATEDVDYMLSNNTFEVSGTGTANFQIDIFNDSEIEGPETIQLEFTFNGETKTSMVTIADDDVEPIVGSATVELITEGFDTTAIPDGWTASQSIDNGLNEWRFNGTSLAAGTAYITYDPFTEPTYDTVGADPTIMEGNSNALLLSPEISAQGYASVTVSFDWMAGGERDTDDAEALFDYGQFQYTIDGGSSFIPVQNFAGTTESLGVTPEMGTFSMEIPALANQTFQLAFRWINDPLVAGPFSFTIDNVLATAEPIMVETAETASDQEVVRANTDIYFVSDENTGILARIENASADLGCVSMVVTSAGSADLVNNSAQGFNRASKVIEIIADEPTSVNASYDLTLYFTGEELSNFGNVANLEMIKVEGSDIDNTSNSSFTIAGSLFEDNIAADGFATFKGSFTGFSVFSIIEDATQGVDEFLLDNISMFPNAIESGAILNIVTANNYLLSTVSVKDINGKTVKDLTINETTKAQISTVGLTTGVYFVSLNNNSNTTLKLLVK